MALVIDLASAMKSFARFWRWLVLLALLCLQNHAARAHDLKVSSIRVRLDARRTTISIVAHDQNVDAVRPAADIARRLQMRLDGKPFRPTNAALTHDARNGLVLWQATQQGAASQVQIDAPLFPEKNNESTVLTVLKNRAVLGEALINAQNPTAQIGDAKAPSTTAVVAQFIGEGVRHIFGGFDHILFLLSLLLLGGSAKQLLKIVTAFTVAHSITLSLAATCIFVPSARFIEPLIALSIVAVACLNLRAADHKESKSESKSLDARPLLALCFGLIHGFGFASALIETGLPRAALGWALVSFNLGVEIGQAALVLAIAPTLAWLVKNRPRWREPLVFYGSTGVAAIGAFWFAQRIFTA